jgi:hypothetical protein
MRARVPKPKKQPDTKWVADVAHQTLATVFYVLYLRNGFTAQELQELKDNVEREFKLMQNGIMGREYNADNCVAFLKEQFGIDFNQSIYE